MRHFQVVGAVFGALAVGLGAFGAHALKAKLTSDGMLETWHTAVLYHVIHSPVLLIVASCAPSRARTVAGWTITSGIALFSGSLYAMCLSGVKALGIITPVGGVLLMIGWIAILGVRLSSDSRATGIGQDA